MGVFGMKKGVPPPHLRREPRYDLPLTADAVAGGRVSVNHRECVKPDKPVEQGDVLTCRGLGKCVVKEVPGQSKKGRTMLVMERYQ